MDDLARTLARAARAQGFNALTVGDAHPDALRDFAALVLEELAARGLLPGEPELGCYAAPRVKAN